MNLMPPGVTKIKLLFQILDLSGGILLKAQEPSKFSFLLLVMKIDTYNYIFQEACLNK
jgi:hypothetical protein